MEGPSKEAVIKHYNQCVSQMENQGWFYAGVLEVWDRLAIPRDAAICDIGCGTGALLARLLAQGYSQLSGTDFAPGCVTAARKAIPEAEVFIHDIEGAPLPRQYDVLTFTSVIDFLADPAAALRHMRASL